MAQKFALTVRLSDDDRRRLDRCAESMGESMSALAAHIIEHDLPMRLYGQQRAKEQEPELVKFAVAVSAADAEVVSGLWEKSRTKFGLRDIPVEQIVGCAVGVGMEIEQHGRLFLDRPKWPPRPANPCMFEVTFDPLSYGMLEDLADSCFESVEDTATAFFKLGLPGYLERNSK
jgi:hypothetical protein